MSMITLNGYNTTPTEITWGLFDQSSEETGRTLDGIMHKDLVSQKRKLSLSWSNIRPDQASAILKAVNQKIFFSVRYPDPMAGVYETRTFYVGDRSAPYKLWANNNKIYASISFDIIEQ